MYPVINPVITEEKIQPDSSLFLTNDGYNGYMFELNESAAEIFRLCDGQHTIADISDKLAGKYGDEYENVYQMVADFIYEAIANRHLNEFDYKNSIPVSLKKFGSDEYWFPETLSIELTRQCHLKCKHCYLNAGVGNELQLSVFDKILKELLDFHIGRVQLTGGEPLLHPHFFDMLTKLVNSNIPVTISTSGAFNAETLISKLACFANKNIAFQISLDGLEAYHDDFRGVSGCFQKTVYFIKKMISYGFNVIVGLTIYEQTDDEIYKLCQMCKSIGVAAIRLGTVFQRGRAVTNIYDNPNRVERTMQLHKKLSSELGTETFRMLFADVGFEDYLEDDLNCGYGYKMIHIASDASVFPCIMSELSIGNLNNETITTILKQRSRIFEIVEAPSEQLCYDCENKVLCKNCINEALHYCKSVDSCAWLCEQKATLANLGGVFTE